MAFSSTDASSPTLTVSGSKLYRRKSARHVSKSYVPFVTCVYFSVGSSEMLFAVGSAYQRSAVRWAVTCRLT